MRFLRTVPNFYHVEDQNLGCDFYTNNDCKVVLYTCTTRARRSVVVISICCILVSNLSCKCKVYRIMQQKSQLIVNLLVTFTNSSYATFPHHYNKKLNHQLSTTNLPFWNSIGTQNSFDLFQPIRKPTWNEQSWL